MYPLNPLDQDEIGHDLLIETLKSGVSKWWIFSELKRPEVKTTGILLH